MPKGKMPKGKTVDGRVFAKNTPDEHAPKKHTPKKHTPKKHMLEVTTIYTDGACSGNPGPGGWGAIAYLSNGQIHEMGGSARATTNNRMEIQAAVEILTWLATSPQTTSPVLYTDSKYVQDGITKWIKGWKKKNWKTTAGKPVLNQDLWRQLDAITQTLTTQLDSPVQWRYVKGHAGNEGNERCDEIARGFSKGQHPALMTAVPWSHDEDRSLASAAVAEPELDVDLEPESGPEPGGAEPGSAEQTSGSGEAIAAVLALKSDATTMPLGPMGLDPQPTPVESLTSRHSPHSQMMIQTMIERLRLADEIAENGYWVTSAELAELLNLTPSTINGKGDRWVWRNWSIVRVHRASTPILWQLERLD